MTTLKGSHNEISAAFDRFKFSLHYMTRELMGCGGICNFLIKFVKITWSEFKCIVIFYELLMLLSILQIYNRLIIF